MATVKKGHPSNFQFVWRVGLVLTAILFVVPVLFLAVNAQEPPVPYNPPVILEATDTATTMPVATDTVEPTNTVPAVTPTSTRIPCPPVGEPAVYGEIRVVYHESVGVDACNLIQRYVSLTNEKFSAMGYETGPIEVAVFTTVDAVTDYTYEKARLAGCNPDSKDIIRSQWTRGGAMSTHGVALFMTTGWWNENPLNERIVAVVHETTHVVQGNYAGSCARSWQVPDWYSEGQAQYFGRLFESQWGIMPADIRSNLLGCRGQLSNLSGDCLYMQGEQAFVLLAHLYGEKSMDVWVKFAEGKSFNTAFYETYGTSVSQFSSDFDAYVKGGYRLP